ncbi:MAG: hypothetical protein H6567_04825 [Lewinellaceae bacterium]|nr:hypothetical protein [Lewinellaceae bacterium]
MALKDLIQQLATETNDPCVTISLNTHRTHPDNLKDGILLKNTIKGAEERLIEKYGKRNIASILEYLEEVPKEIDSNYNLDSLHLFVSNDTQEFIRSPWPTHHAGVHISEHFAIRPLIKAYNRSEEYMIMVVTQNGVHMYEALNDVILNEVRNEDFPYTENTHHILHSDRRTDPKQIDDMMREYLNKLDRAVVKLHHDTNFQCIVISTDEVYHKLLEVADRPQVYLGHASINFNHVTEHDLSHQAYEILKNSQNIRRRNALDEINEAVGHGKVLTDLQEIFQASLDGRGDLLMVLQDFEQAVVMTGDRTFQTVDDPHTPHAIDDITSTIAWEVMSKKGRVIFTEDTNLKKVGSIVLKTRW